MYKDKNELPKARQGYVFSFLITNVTCLIFYLLEKKIDFAGRELKKMKKRNGMHVADSG